MDDQTEWFDDQYYDSPPELPSPTTRELFEQLAAQFQISMKTVADAYRPIAKAFGSVFQGQHIHSVQLDEVKDFADGKISEDAIKRIIDQNKYRNHGPRSGDPYMLNGKRKW